MDIIVIYMILVMMNNAPIKVLSQLPHAGKCGAYNHGNRLKFQLPPQGSGHLDFVI